MDPDGKKSFDIYHFDDNGNITNIEPESWFHNLFFGHTGILSDGTEFHISLNMAKHLYTNFSYDIFDKDHEAVFGVITTVETDESVAFPKNSPDDQRMLYSGWNWSLNYQLHN